MARGWESKSVESQQEAAAAKQSPAARFDPQEAQRRAERATLMLARTRALADLQHACAPAHRAMLEQAIADLHRRLAAAGLVGALARFRFLDWFCAPLRQQYAGDRCRHRVNFTLPEAAHFLAPDPNPDA